jgi:hypothetical protein
MRGNHFSPIDFGKRQRQIHNPNKNNRRVIQYSYNLINNTNEEELSKKDNVHQVLNTPNTLVKSHPSNGYQYDAYGRAVERRQGPERKLSLPSTQLAATQRNGLLGFGSKPKPGENPQVTSSRERKTSWNYSQTAINRTQQAADLLEFEKYKVHSGARPIRHSDPLYEQRSLPPLPYSTSSNNESSANADAADILGNAKCSQLSKSQNYLSTSGTFSRKEGLSAVENQEIMQGKMRKKAVCDKTDDSHYQRQFLRVLNKRF